jgi:ABC-2 type transport system permease protein
MKKILTIANREFWAIVGTKAFLVSLAIMPVMMFGGVIAMRMLQDRGGIDEKRIAVVDHSQQFFEILSQSAQMHNRALEFVEKQNGGKSGSHDSPDEIAADDPTPPSGVKGSKYVLEQVAAGEMNDQKRLELSQRVRNQELAAFLEIPADVIESNSAELFSEDAGFSALSSWIGGVLNERAKSLRFESLGLNPATVQQATQPVRLRSLGLVQVNSEGKIQAAEEKNPLTGLIMPMVFMLLMFMVIFMSAQPMLESVLEEKAQRIAEVLLGSVSPAQLMTGKLIGSVAGSLTIVFVYFVGAFLFAQQKGYTDLIPLNIIPWFILFQILGVMFYAAIFMAVGASVSQLKEAQSMLLPAWMLLMSPMFVWFVLVQEPNGRLAFWLSMFPPATSTTMVLRMATGVTIPFWQPLAGVVILLISTAACVLLAARIFRVGILWQGKTPKLSEIVRWAFSG